MRLFAGIELDAATRARCTAVQDRLRATGLDARYEPGEKLHVTLAFLGRVDDAQISDVERVLDQTAGAHAPFALMLDKLGAFPHERRPRVIFIGARAQGAPFRMLANDLHTRYAALGFRFDDDAVAHVTIAHVKGGSTRPLPLLDVAPIELRIAQLALFESLPEGATTRYIVRRVSAMKS